LITQRGHNRLPCFLDGADYLEFKQALWDSAEQNDTAIHAALMLPQAYWVLASPAQPDGIARTIQRTGRCYVRHCNAKYRREGTLWAGRYQACLVQRCREHMDRCASYLAMTPGRAGVVAAGAPWPWLFLEEGLTPGDALIDDNAYREMSTILKRGQVLGDPPYCRDIARTAGVRIGATPRGRPRKTEGT
jgi:putative transposase